MSERRADGGHQGGPGVIVGAPRQHFMDNRQASTARTFDGIRAAALQPVSDHEAIRRSLHSAGRSLVQVRETLAPAVASLGEMVRHYEAALGPLAASSEPEEEDPFERAMRLRRDRNTGPARDPHRRRGRG